MIQAISYSSKNLTHKDKDEDCLLPIEGLSSYNRKTLRVLRIQQSIKFMKASTRSVKTIPRTSGQRGVEEDSRSGEEKQPPEI